MMYENQVFVTYKGIRTYQKKDGTEGSTPIFSDMHGRVFQMFVKESENLKDIPVDSKVIAYQLHDCRFDKESNRPNNKIFYKSVELAVIKD